MSILDTFVILFESDASKLDKGLTDADRKAKELTTGLKETDGVAGKLGGSLASGLAAFAGAALAAVSLGALVSAMFSAVDAADNLSKAAKAANTDIGTFTAWSDLIKKSGGSAEGFAASLGGLNRQLAQMDVTGKSRAAPFLKELGIDLDNAANKGKTAMDFLPQLADSFASMDSAKAISLGSKLGLDQATIMTLQAGRREVEAMIAKEKELGTVTQKQADISEKFNDTIDDSKHAFRSVLLGISEFVLPPLTWMMEKFQVVAIFMSKHSDLMAGLMMAVGAAILVFALPPLYSMAAAAVVAFAPFIMAGAIIAALAAAFALLYEDVMIFMEGGDSMIGAIIERWPIIGDIIKAIVAEFMFFWDMAKAVGAFLVGLFTDPAAAFEAFKNLVTGGLNALVERFPGLKSVVDMVTGAFTAAGQTITGVWDAIVAAIQAAIATVMSAISTVSGAYDSVKSFFGGGSEKAPGVAEGQAALASAGSSPLTSQTSNSISNQAQSSKSTTVNVGKVEVKTQATDADGISRAIGGTMQAQMRQAVGNSDDGILA